MFDIIGYFCFGVLAGGVMGFVSAALLAASAEVDEEDEENDRDHEKK